MPRIRNAVHAENISNPARRPNCKPAYCRWSRSTLHTDRKQWACDAASSLSALHARYGAVTALAQQNGWPMLFLYCYLMRRKTLSSKIPSSLRFSGCKSWCRDFNLFFSPLFREPRWEFRAGELRRPRLGWIWKFLHEERGTHHKQKTSVQSTKERRLSAPWLPLRPSEKHQERNW